MARNTTLSFGLVSIEASIDKAITDGDKDVRLESAGPEGQKVKQVYVDDDGQQFGRADLTKGKWINDDTFVEVPADKLEEIKDLTAGDGVLDLTFEDRESVDLTAAVAPYFVKAKKGYEDKLALLAAAMEAENVVAVATFVPTSRQHLLAIFVEDGVVRAAQLPYAVQRKEVPAAAKVDTDAVDKKALELARKLVNAAKGEVTESATDEAVALKAEALEAALAGKALPKPKKAKKVEAPTDDLTGLLEASLSAAAK